MNSEATIHHQALPDLSEIQRAIGFSIKKHDLKFEDLNLSIDDDGSVVVEYDVILKVFDEIRFYGEPDSVDMNILSTDVISSWYKLHLANNGKRNESVEFLMYKSQAEQQALQNGYSFDPGHS